VNEIEHAAAARNGKGTGTEGVALTPRLEEDSPHVRTGEGLALTPWVLSRDRTASEYRRASRRFVFVLAAVAAINLSRAEPPLN